MKTFWRIIEWVLALAWPFVAYASLFTYDLTTEAKLRASVYPLSMLVPMVGPVAVRLLSAPALDRPKRFALLALLLSGAVLVLSFQNYWGRPNVPGFFLPMSLYAVAVFLWIGWRRCRAVAA